jgi:uncharacterized protein DUF1259
MVFAARISARVLLSVGIVTATAANAAAQARVSSARFWRPVEEALGRKGTLNPGDVLKFGFPRADLHVVLGGVTLKPALALGSWVAFKRIGDHVMAMGDLVLLEEEVAPVMGSLQQNGVEQTALHNHLRGESPRVMYMHIRAIGDPGRIARALRSALEFTDTPFGPVVVPPPPLGVVPPPAAPPPPVYDLDTATIAKVIGVRGRMNGGVYQLSIPRRGKILEDKMEIPPSMGISTAINFQATGPGKAAITGDFVVFGKEVNPVIWALSENGIDVTAIHSHMTTEQPRLFFMHFWANDDVGKLARGLRAALDRTRALR